MPMRMRVLAATWVGLIIVGGVTGGALEALGAPEAPPASSLTVRPGAVAQTPPAASGQSAVVAQSGLGAGPLQGPLAAPGTASGAGCCPCRPVHRVVHHRRVVRREPPVLVAQAPLVPLVPLVPYRPVYVYRPLVAYRPLVPIYPRPFFYRPFFRPYGIY